jgi:hypothetical protein
MGDTLDGAATEPAARVVAHWLTGAAIAGTTAPLAAAREGLDRSLVFVAVALALVARAASTARGRPWAVRASVVLLAGQLLGVIGPGWELAHGIAPRTRPTCTAAE